MKETLEALCGHLTAEERLALVNTRWFRQPGAMVTTIPYTFDISQVSADLIASGRDLNLQHLNILSLSENAITQLQLVLQKWTKACGSWVRFEHVPTLLPGQPGITFAGCDTFDKIAGLTTWSHRVDPLTGHRLFESVLVRVPTKVSHVQDILVMSHETGHALGLEHIQAIPSLEQRLRVSKQGLGCSVMGYVGRLRTENNSCSTEAVCLQQSYAVYPGPFDKEVCTSLYEISPDPRPPVWAAMAATGFASGVLERFLFACLAGIQYRDQRMPPAQAANLSLILSSMLLLGVQSSFAVPGFLLALLECYARSRDNEYLELIQLLRIFTLIASVLLFFYTLYADEEALTKGLNMLVFLASSLLGLAVGRPLGYVAALASNLIIDKGCCVYDNSLRGLSSLRHRFFAGEGDIEADEAISALRCSV